MQNLSKPVRGVFFDLGWTLVYPPSGDFAFSKFAQQFFPPEVLAGERGKAALERATETLNRDHLLSRPEEEVEKYRQFYRDLAAALPELAVTPEDCDAMARDKVYRLENFALYPRVLETLEALKGRYQLGIISDTWPGIEAVLEHLGLTPYFSAVTFSYRLGVMKPDPRMYQDALEKMGLPPQECVFVDDTMGNLRGAERAGIQPVFIATRPGAEPCPPEMARVSEISGILQLLQ